MHITAANTGDLLCLYQTGEWVRVLDANDAYVVFQREDGERYASNQRHVDAFVERDPTRISIFNDNCRLGQVLHAAELGALKARLREHPGTEVERCSADRVIAIVQEHWDKTFMQKQSRQREGIPGKALARAFLDQLYEMGTGSHDTFFGRKVENMSQHFGRFLINGATFDYDSALLHLSHSTMVREMPGAGRRTPLDAQIQSASKRKTPTMSERQTKKFEKEFF